MKKRILIKALQGFLPGIAIGYIITIVISFFIGNGYYGSVVPSFQRYAGSEINAVIIQTILCGMIGAVFSGADIIWGYEKWTLLKRTFVFYIITVIPMIAIALFLHWILLTPAAVISYLIVFTIIFFLIWASIYLKIKNEVEEINKQLKK